MNMSILLSVCLLVSGIGTKSVRSYWWNESHLLKGKTYTSIILLTTFYLSLIQQRLPRELKKNILLFCIYLYRLEEKLVKL